MTNSSPNVYETINQYFSHMDDAPVGGNSIFQDDRAKEKHETIIMYAFRKYRAALYHSENVRRFLEDESSDLDSKKILDSDTFTNNTRAKITVRKTADHFVYELAAFFEASKSSLDFIAAASSWYLNGINTDSIRTLIRCVNRNTGSGIIFNVTKEHLSWLKEVREYRHHLVHRMIISTSIGHEIHRRGQMVKTSKHPVVVPESTPAYFPDTRRARMMEDEPRGLNSSRFEGLVKHSDGTEQLIDFSIEYTPAEGYVEISSLMANHLNHLGKFFFDMVTAMKSMNYTKHDK